jgi:putative FmdB family regulatory protein
MPTYEYACKTCGHRFEAWQKITDEPLTECPNCQSEIRRVLFAAGVVFKGSGFYSTDSRGHNSDAESPAESKSEPGTESKAESKTESKIEPSAESKAESKTEPAAVKPANETAKAS